MQRSNRRFTNLKLHSGLPKLLGSPTVFSEKTRGESSKSPAAQRPRNDRSFYRGKFLFSWQQSAHTPLHRSQTVGQPVKSCHVAIARLQIIGRSSDSRETSRMRVQQRTRYSRRFCKSHASWPRGPRSRVLYLS